MTTVTDTEHCPDTSFRETEHLVQGFLDGTAEKSDAYEHGMKMIAFAGRILRDFDVSSVEKMSRPEGIELLDDLKEAKEHVRIAAHLFDKYPIVALAAEGMREAIFYSEVALAPLVIMGSSGDRKRERPVSTYVIKNPHSGLIKIGRTCDLKTRIQALQCGSGAALEVIAVIPSDIEGDLHARFGEYRVHGEWFDDRDGVISTYAEGVPSDNTLDY